MSLPNFHIPNLGVSELQNGDQVMPFGVEIETCSPRTLTHRVGMYHRGVSCPATPCFNGSRWKAESDSSIRPNSGYRAIEYVSPKLAGEQGLTNVRKMMKWLRESGHRVNSTCGMHIHVGLTGIVGPNASPDDVVAFLATLGQYVINYQDGLYAQTGTRRDLNGYCSRHRMNEGMSIRLKELKEKTTRDSRDQYNLAGNSQRQKCVNLTRTSNLSGSATIEFRFGAGTMNFDKFLMHLFSCLYLCRLAWKNRNGWARGWRSDPRIHSDPTTAGVKTFKHLLWCFKSSEAGKGLKAQSATFRNRWERMLEVSHRMAVKYDSRCPADNQAFHQ